MQKNRTLSNCRIGDEVAIANNAGKWRVEVIRNVTSKKGRLKKDTFRRHPERLRSNTMARLRNLKTGRLRSVWFAEVINVEIVSEVVLSDHAIQRAKNRSFTKSDIAFIVKYGLKKPVHDSKDCICYHITKDQIKHLPEFKHLAGAKIIANLSSNTIITMYWDKDVKN